MPTWTVYIKNLSDPNNQAPRINCVFEEDYTADTEDIVRSQVEFELSRTGVPWQDHYQYWIYPKN